MSDSKRNRPSSLSPIVTPVVQGATSSLSSSTSKRRKTTPSPSATTFTDIAPDPPYYDFAKLIASSPDLRRHATSASSLDFRRNPREVNLSLTRAILRHHFRLDFHLPSHHLIPTIPNRQQYLEWAVSLLPSSSKETKHTLLDIGTGPSCIYPLLAARLYPTWHIVAADIDASAIKSARHNVSINDLMNSISIIHSEKDENVIFTKDIMKYKPDLSVCNPPFYSDEEEDEENFKHTAGTRKQMATPGGEVKFISGIAKESTTQYTVHWFTSLIGCKSSLSPIISMLRSPNVNAVRVRTVRLCTGGRTVRWAVAWTFGNSISSAASILHSSWRSTLRITPGRIYANQLTISDIADVCTVALMQFGWRLLDVNDDCSSVVNIIATAETGFPNSHVILHVTGPVDGVFSVTIKVERRASMTVLNFRGLCDQLTEDVPLQLDQISSSST